MFKELTPWLEQKFPDINFPFVQSFNTMDYYKDLLARGEEMPDIITCRRFSLNDAAALSEHLMPLRHWASRGSRQTGTMITVVWKLCRDVLFPN